MNQSIRKYMKPGQIHFMAYPQTMDGESDIIKTLKMICKDPFFDAVEITHIKDPTIRKEARALMDTAGMERTYGAQPRLLMEQLNPNALDEVERRKVVDVLKECVDEAQEMGCSAMAFLSGIYEDSTKEIAYEQLVKTTSEICRYAKNSGLQRIALEVFDYDVDKCALIGPADLAKRFAQEICQEHSNFGLLVDLSHLPLLRETVKESLLPIRDYIAHAHIGNAVVTPGLPAYGDMHPRFGFPGGTNGVEELVEFLQVLLDIKFLNSKNPPIVSFEVKPFCAEDPELVIANAKRTLCKAWACCIG